MRIMTALVLGSIAVAAIASACGDDDPVATPEATPDGAAPDRTTPPGSDSSTEDSPVATPDAMVQPTVLASNLDTPQNVTGALGALLATVTGENRIVRIELDGGAMTNVTGSPVAPWDVSAGPFGFNGFVGWTEGRDGGAARAGTVICQAGSCNNLAAFSTTEGLVRHIRFDGTRDVYWAVEDLGLIRHKDPLSGPIGTLVSGETGVYGLAIYQPTVYFTRREASGKLKKVDTNADANSFVELASNLNMPEGVAIDSISPPNVWVADTGNDRIAVCAAAGCNGTATTFAPATRPHEVTVDQKNVYWTNAGTGPTDGSVQWCAKTGCPKAGPNTLAVAQANPSGIWVDTAHVYWANAAKPGAILRIAKP